LVTTGAGPIRANYLAFEHLVSSHIVFVIFHEAIELGGSSGFLNSFIRVHCMIGSPSIQHHQETPEVNDPRASRHPKGAVAADVSKRHPIASMKITSIFAPFPNIVIQCTFWTGKIQPRPG
jgi:hypothetical protein